MLNFEVLSDLIKKAQGERSLNQFALHAGIDAGHLSRIINKKVNSAPTPSTLKKIAEHALGSVTYHELMLAAGYLDADINYSEVTDEEIGARNKKSKEEPDFIKNLAHDLEHILIETKIISPADDLSEHDYKTILKFLESNFSANAELIKNSLDKS